MPRHSRLLLVAALAIVSAACSPLSPAVRSDAVAGVPFTALLADPDRWRGATVILGGYILETENLGSETLVRLLQTPLTPGDEPGPRDGSLGRFQVACGGFLDPEVYREGRRLTVAGRVLGADMRSVAGARVPYLLLQAVEIHLWKEYAAARPYPAYYPYGYDGWYDPFYWPRPYFHRPRFYRPHPPRPHPPGPPPQGPRPPRSPQPPGQAPAR